MFFQSPSVQNVGRFRGILKGLQFLHDRKHCHFNLKFGEALATVHERYSLRIKFVYSCLYTNVVLCDIDSSTSTDKGIGK